MSILEFILLPLTTDCRDTFHKSVNNMAYMVYTSHNSMKYMVFALHKNITVWLIWCPPFTTVWSYDLYGVHLSQQYDCMTYMVFPFHNSMIECQNMVSMRTFLLLCKVAAFNTTHLHLSWNSTYIKVYQTVCIKLSSPWTRKGVAKPWPFTCIAGTNEIQTS